MLRRRRFLIGSAAMGSSAALAAGARAQSYPTRPKWAAMAKLSGAEPD